MEFNQVRVLVAEDMEEMRGILVRLLQAMGFAQIRAVRNGEEAWPRMGKHAVAEKLTRAISEYFAKPSLKKGKTS